MTLHFASRCAMTLALVALCGTLALTQTSPAIAPLRTPPVETLTVNPGFRDWARAVLWIFALTNV